MVKLEYNKLKIKKFLFKKFKYQIISFYKFKYKIILLDKFKFQVVSFLYIMMKKLKKIFALRNSKRIHSLIRINKFIFGLVN